MTSNDKDDEDREWELLDKIVKMKPEDSLEERIAKLEAEEKRA